MCDFEEDEEVNNDILPTVSYWLEFEQGLPATVTDIEKFLRWWAMRGAQAASALYKYSIVKEQSFSHRQQKPCIEIRTGAEGRYDSEYEKVFYFSYEDFFSDKSLYKVVEDFNKAELARARQARQEIEERAKARDAAAVQTKQEQIRGILANLSKAFPELIIEASEAIKSK